MSKVQRSNIGGKLKKLMTKSIELHRKEKFDMLFYEVRQSQFSLEKVYRARVTNETYIN